MLIINFNHPYYSNIEYLESLYSPVFNNIIFYGEKEDPRVVKVTSNMGYFLSPIINDVMLRFPGYKGYLFLQDDCVLHFWNLLKLNKEKIWYAVKFNDGISHNKKFYSVCNTHGYVVEGFSWDKWNRACGLSAAAAAYQNLAHNDLNIIQSNLGKNNVAAQMCEVFYIPKAFKKSFCRLSAAFKNVFCEIAIPTMLCCLDLIANWEKLDMLGGSGVGTGEPNNFLFKHYPLEASWIHPIKFSYKENREIVSDIFHKFLVEHSE